jgi:hypothetical protein
MSEENVKMPIGLLVYVSVLAIPCTLMVILMCKLLIKMIMGM